MVNKVILIGNVGADPEVKYLNEGAVTAKLNIATSESYYDKHGEKVTKTEWHNCVLWNNLAKLAEKHIKKGMQLYVEGKITTRSYEKDGEKRYSTEIMVSEMKFIGKKENSSSNQSESTLDIPTPDSADDLPF